MTFNSTSDLSEYIKMGLSDGLKNTCDELEEQLMQSMMKNYYDCFTPSTYQRTGQFLGSAKSEMVSDLRAEVFADYNAMHYTGQPPVWTGTQQLYGAERGYHGQLKFRGGGQFFSKFEQYCDKNLKNLLKKNIKAQGIPIQ